MGDAVEEVDGCLQERWGGRGCFGVSGERGGDLRQGWWGASQMSGVNTLPLGGKHWGMDGRCNMSMRSGGWL